MEEDKHKTMKRNILILLVFVIMLFSPSLVSAAEAGWIDLIQNENVYSIPNTPKPNYLETITDPVFGTKVTRVTGDPGDPIITKTGETIGTWGDVARHHYSKDQPWNADESLIHITRNYEGSPGSLFLDGETYEVLFARSVPGDHRWHPTDPDLKIYVSGNRIGYFDVRSGENTVIRTFSEYGRLDMGPYEGNPSLDGRMIVLYGDNSEVFAYDLWNDHKYPTKVATGIDWASISPLGNYVVIMYGDTNTQVFDLNMNFVSKFTVNHNHYDLGLDENGEEVAVGISKSSVYDGLIIEHRLKDVQLTKLTQGGYAVHTSMRNRARPGWAYSSTAAVTRHPPYNDEVIAIKTDGSMTIQRFCHMHNNDVDYYSEAMPVPSRDGRRVFFASNWDAPSRPVGGYIVDARSSATPSPCSCTSWQDDQCGGGSCASDMMYQTRTCTPASCDTESQCVADPSCEASSDTTPPSTPSNLQAIAISSSQINLSWSPSTDNMGVTGYRIYRDGSYLTSTSNTSYSHTGLSPLTNYTYTISAYDAAGNNSSPLASSSATTFSRADLNQDGQVNLEDFIQLITRWLRTSNITDEDLNNDNRVDTKDLGIMMSNWNK